MIPQAEIDRLEAMLFAAGITAVPALPLPLADMPVPDGCDFVVRPSFEIEWRTRRPLREMGWSDADLARWSLPADAHGTTRTPVYSTDPLRPFDHGAGGRGPWTGWIISILRGAPRDCEPARVILREGIAAPIHPRSTHAEAALAEVAHLGQLREQATSDRRDLDAAFWRAASAARAAGASAYAIAKAGRVTQRAVAKYAPLTAPDNS